MLHFYERRRVRAFLFSKLFLVPLFVLCVLLGRAAWNAYERERVTAHNLAEAQEALVAIEQRKHALEADIASLEDPLGLETEVRSKYNVGRTGEHMVVLVGEEGTDTKEATTTQVDMPWYRRAWKSATAVLHGPGE